MVVGCVQLRNESSLKFFKHEGYEAIVVAVVLLIAVVDKVCNLVFEVPVRRGIGLIHVLLRVAFKIGAFGQDHCAIHPRLGNFVFIQMTATFGFYL